MNYLECQSFEHHPFVTSTDKYTRMVSECVVKGQNSLYATFISGADGCYASTFVCFCISFKELNITPPLSSCYYFVLYYSTFNTWPQFKIQEAVCMNSEYLP